jgi:hypothetical protein
MSAQPSCKNRATGGTAIMEYAFRSQYTEEQKSGYWAMVLAAGAPANDCACAKASHPLAETFAHTAIGYENEGQFVIFLTEHAGPSYVVARFADDVEIYAEWMALAKRLGLPRYCIVAGGIAVPFESEAPDAFPRRRAHVLAKRRPRFLAKRKQSILTYADSLTPTTPDRRSSGR